MSEVQKMDLLDFETDDALLIEQAPKRRKVICLDDLLTDFYNERTMHDEKKSTRAVQKRKGSDDDGDHSQKNKEALLSKFVNDFQKQVHGMDTDGENSSLDDNITSWGLQIFGQKKKLPSLEFTTLESCYPFQCFLNSGFNLKLELDSGKGKNFIEALLLDGWLQKLVQVIGHVDDTLASWTFNLTLYSDDEELRKAACEFFLASLPSKNEVNFPSVRLKWFPGYNHLKDALINYGYLTDNSPVISSLSSLDQSSCSQEGPPPNIISWAKILGACCEVRRVHSMFSTSEVEEFLGIIVLFFLDRKLEGLFLLFNECMQSITNFFTDDEWIDSSKNVANALACRIPKDSNCLRLLECFSGVSNRSKHLRSELALQILLNCFEMKPTDAEEALASILSINLKDKRCNFFKIYIYLVLVENWLCSIEQTPDILRTWGAFLRKCSCQITSTDWRSFASKVRNRASYLLQSLKFDKDVQ